jgi:hypothetical protein
LCFTHLSMHSVWILLPHPNLQNIRLSSTDIYS